MKPASCGKGSEIRECPGLILVRHAPTKTWLGGTDEGRLSIMELASLVDLPKVQGPDLTPGASALYANVQTDVDWSATMSADNPKKRLASFLRDRQGSLRLQETITFHAWRVRARDDGISIES